MNSSKVQVLWFEAQGTLSVHTVKCGGIVPRQLLHFRDTTDITHGLHGRLVKSHIATGAQHHHIGDITRGQHADPHFHHHAVACGRRPAPLLADVTADHIIITGRHLITDLVGLGPLVLGFLGQQIRQSTGAGFLLLALQSGDAFGFSLLLAFGFIRSTTPCFFLTLARLLGCLAPGFFLGGLLFGLFLGQSSGRLGTPCLFRLLPFDLLSLPSFLSGLLFLGSALRCGGRLALFGLTLLLGLTLLFSGARGLLFLLALLLLLGQLLGFMPLGCGAFGLTGNALLGLGGRRALGIELYQRRLNYGLGRLEFGRLAEGDEQQHGDQQVNAQRLDQGSAEALFVRLHHRSVAHGASVIRPTLGTPDCCRAAIAATTTPWFTSRSPRI